MIAMEWYKYWQSPEAKTLFLGDPNDERDVIKVLETRIERLKQVNRTMDGWRDVIERHDKDNLCSPGDIFMMRQKCSILCLAYSYALSEMNSARWIEDCSQQAITSTSKLGICVAGADGKTVAGWSMLLTSNHEHVPLPNTKNLLLKNLESTDY